MDKYGALSLVDEMRETGRKLLDKSRTEEVWIEYQKKLDKIKTAIDNGGNEITKLVLNEGDLIIFQNKRVPY